MKKSIRDIPKTTGRGKGVLVRLHKDQITALEQWIATLDPPPTRPEAIRRLVEQALQALKKKRH